MRRLGEGVAVSAFCVALIIVTQGYGLYPVVDSVERLTRLHIGYQPLRITVEGLVWIVIMLSLYLGVYARRARSIAPAALLAALLLTGCTSAITLRHPDGRMVKCGPYNAYGVRAFMAGDQERACVADYQRQGFERAPE